MSPAYRDYCRHLRRRYTLARAGHLRGAEAEAQWCEQLWHTLTAIEKKQAQELERAMQADLARSNLRPDGGAK